MDTHLLTLGLGEAKYLYDHHRESMEESCSPHEGEGGGRGRGGVRGRGREREEGEEGEREGDREEGRGEREGQGEREEGQEGEAGGGGEKRKREKRSRRGGGGSLIAYQGRHRQMVHALGSEPQEIILGKTNPKQGKILTMSNSKVSCREERSV